MSAKEISGAKLVLAELKGGNFLISNKMSLPSRGMRVSPLNSPRLIKGMSCKVCFVLNREFIRYVVYCGLGYVWIECFVDEALQNKCGEQITTFQGQVAKGWPRRVVCPFTISTLGMCAIGGELSAYRLENRQVGVLIISTDEVQLEDHAHRHFNMTSKATLLEPNPAPLGGSRNYPLSIWSRIKSVNSESLQV